MATNPFQKSLSRGSSDSNIKETRETDSPPKSPTLHPEKIYTIPIQQKETPKIVTGLEGASMVAKKVLSGLDRDKESKVTSDQSTKTHELEEKLKSPHIEKKPPMQEIPVKEVFNVKNQDMELKRQKKSKQKKFRYISLAEFEKQQKMESINKKVSDNKNEIDQKLKKLKDDKQNKRGVYELFNKAKASHNENESKKQSYESNLAQKRNELSGKENDLTISKAKLQELKEDRRNTLEVQRTHSHSQAEVSNIIKQEQENLSQYKQQYQEVLKKLEEHQKELHRAKQALEQSNKTLEQTKKDVNARQEQYTPLIKEVQTKLDSEKEEFTSLTAEMDSFKKEAAESDKNIKKLTKEITYLNSIKVKIESQVSTNDSVDYSPANEAVKILQTAQSTDSSKMPNIEEKQIAWQETLNSLREAFELPQQSNPVEDAKRLLETDKGTLVSQNVIRAQGENAFNQAKNFFATTVDFDTLQSFNEDRKIIGQTYQDLIKESQEITARMQDEKESLLRSLQDRLSCEGVNVGLRDYCNLLTTYIDKVIPFLENPQTLDESNKQALSEQRKEMPEKLGHFSEYAIQYSGENTESIIDSFRKESKRDIDSIQRIYDIILKEGKLDNLKVKCDKIKERINIQNNLASNSHNKKMVECTAQTLHDAKKIESTIKYHREITKYIENFIRKNDFLLNKSKKAYNNLIKAIDSVLTETVEKEIIHKKYEINALSDEYAVKNTQIRKISLSINQYQQNIGKAYARRDAIWTQQREIASDLYPVQQNSETCQKHVTDLEKEISGTQLEVDNLQKTIQRTNEKIAILKQNQDISIVRAESTTINSNQKQEEIKEAKKEINGINSVINDLKGEIRTIEREYRTFIDDTYQKSKEHLLETFGKVESIEQEIQILLQQVQEDAPSSEQSPAAEIPNLQKTLKNQISEQSQEHQNALNKETSFQKHLNNEKAQIDHHTINVNIKTYQEYLSSISDINIRNTLLKPDSIPSNTLNYLQELWTLNSEQYNGEKNSLINLDEFLIDYQKKFIAVCNEADSDLRTRDTLSSCLNELESSNQKAEEITKVIHSGAFQAISKGYQDSPEYKSQRIENIIEQGQLLDKAAQTPELVKIENEIQKTEEDIKNLHRNILRCEDILKNQSTGNKDYITGELFMWLYSYREQTETIRKNLAQLDIINDTKFKVKYDSKLKVYDRTLKDYKDLLRQSINSHGILLFDSSGIDETKLNEFLQSKAKPFDITDTSSKESYSSIKGKNRQY